jgi:hypothetical protein
VDLFKIPEEQKAPRLADLGINFKAIDHALSVAGLRGRSFYLSLFLSKCTELKEDKFKNIQDFTGPTSAPPMQPRQQPRRLKMGAAQSKGSDRF